jgi:hypothetical protein
MRFKWGALESASLRRKSESSARSLLNRWKAILKQWTFMNLVRNTIRKILVLSLTLLSLHCSNLFKSDCNISYVGFEILRTVVTKSCISWDITQRSLLSVNRRFEGTYHVHLQCRIKAKVETIFSLCWYLSWHNLRTWRWRWYVPPKRRLIFNGLHGAVSKNIGPFVIIAVRDSNHT